MTGGPTTGAIGTPLERLDGFAKVTGTARYAAEQQTSDPVHVHLILATIARGRVRALHTADAEGVDGVLGVMTHHDAPVLPSSGSAELAVLQSDEVAYRGQIIGAVLAGTREVAAQAAELVRVDYEQWSHEADVSFDGHDLDADGLVDPDLSGDTDTGHVDEHWERSPSRVDHVYSTPFEHNNPMEPHATVAQWADGELVLHDSSQGVHATRALAAKAFGLDRERVRVISPYVGGGFGSKGMPHPPLVLAGLAAMSMPGRVVTLSVTRQQMFMLVGYRPRTIQRLRLAADHSGQLVSLAHEVIATTSRVEAYVEQAGAPSRTMYAAPHRRIAHRLAPLDLPVPTWMRAPGECPGMFSLEVAMDELAERCGVDPVEFRIRNEPDVDPGSGKPYSSRNLVRCLREGAERFGWGDRRSWRDGRWLVGTGVSSSVFPAGQIPGSSARVVVADDGRYRVEIGAADIGTGTWTALTQIAAEALDVRVERIDLHIGDTSLPKASLAGGSTGLASWGPTVAEAARLFRLEHGENPAPGAETTARMPENPTGKDYAKYAFGAQFAEVRVDADTGEIRVPRMLGVFAAGRIVNPRTARSQFVGGMTMGVSMALHEDSVVDSRFGHVVNHDFAGYHIAANADIGEIEATWVDEHDPHVNSLGVKGIGEIGIVGSAAAIVNAAYAATGVRVRDLPMTPEAFLR